MNTELLTEDFRQAASDYRYLIERGYSRKSALKLAGDRYGLTSCHRTLLYRGILPRIESERRRARLTASTGADRLTIDGYNVVVTVANYLYGRPVFLGTDGFLRDAGEAYGRLTRGPMFDKAVLLLLSFLEPAGDREVLILFDRPVPKSGELAVHFREEMRLRAIEGTAETARSPDYELKRVRTGSVCTSDSVVIDGCPVPVCDLAREVLDAAFSPDYIDLGSLFLSP